MARIGGIHPFSLLPSRMNNLSKETARGVSKLVRQVAIGIGATVVDATRVDTGLARSNWRATLSRPATGTIPAYAPGNNLGKGETANASAAKTQHQQVFGRFNVKKHKSAVITNNVSYIETLNRGRPGVSPDDMVRQGLQTGRLILKSTKVLDTR